MSRLQKLGALAMVCLFTAAVALPADAQARKRSGSSGGSGARAVPRSASSGGGQASAPRAARGSDQAAAQGASGASREPQQPRGSQRPREGARPRPADAPVTGQAVARPPYRPGGGGGQYPGSGYGSRYPYYGYRGHYPFYGYRYYPWYGYRWYSPGFYWGTGAYFGPYFYSPWVYSSWWGWPAYDDGWAYAAPSGAASLKVNVEPKTAEVYVDGYLAGIVDQFDGMFQSLSIEPGDHEITIYQEGYRSLRQRLHLSPGSTMRIKGTMERLAPGEPNEPRPMRPAAPPSGEVDGRLPSQSLPAPQYQTSEPQAPPPAPVPPVAQAPETYPAPGDSRYGQLAIRVQPADAEVLIDGEVWRAPTGAERLVVSLAPGTHRVEIRREGYDAFVTAIDVRRGETTPLNVSLARF